MWCTHVVHHMITDRRSIEARSSLARCCSDLACCAVTWWYHTDAGGKFETKTVSVVLSLVDSVPPALNAPTVEEWVEALSMALR